ncbi:hypothetical protein LTLLF_132245 [Microtus ochrogaster]|uniref:Uncharacterized protein n=1 Tax=Microtus ochrogaster TaxID=79684 RepID=A0A8J6GQF2_MICOH|nr:hypothetical protein LTLLF_132245 [Microtus ochrogaster]
MSSASKIRHRSEPMPEIMVKIIGSKYFRYLVEKPKINQNEKSKTEPQTTLQKSRADYSRQVSRDLPGPPDPSDQKITSNPAEKGDSKHPGSSQKPENNQKFSSRNRFLDGRLLTEMEYAFITTTWKKFAVSAVQLMDFCDSDSLLVL